MGRGHLILGLFLVICGYIVLDLVVTLVFLMLLGVVRV